MAIKGLGFDWHESTHLFVVILQVGVREQSEEDGQPKEEGILAFESNLESEMGSNFKKENIFRKAPYFVVDLGGVQANLRFHDVVEGGEFVIQEAACVFSQK